MAGGNRKEKQQRDRPQDKRYWSGAWRRARLAYIKKQPTCVVCDRLAKVVDHIQPVRLGGEFWDSSNWQALCNRCHNHKSFWEMQSCRYSWRPRPDRTVVCGKPRSGKSTWVEQHVAANAWVWDFDAEAAKAGWPDYPRPLTLTRRLLRERTHVIDGMRQSTRSCCVIVADVAPAWDIAERLHARVVHCRTEW